MLALLAKADRTAEERVGEKVVYEAMADTLSDAWGTLIAHLERRRSLLQHASEFFDRALEVNATVVQSRPNFHSVAHVFFPPPFLNGRLHQHCQTPFQLVTVYVFIKTVRMFFPVCFVLFYFQNTKACSVFVQLLW